MGLRKPELEVADAQLKSYLVQPGNVSIATQDPWYVANENISVRVKVLDLGEMPAQVLTMGEDRQRHYVVRPDLLVKERTDALQCVAKKLKVPIQQLGFYFCKKNMVPSDLLACTNRSEYQQSVQYVKNFDPALKGSQYAQVRQQLSHSLRIGLTFEANLTYNAHQISDVVTEWTTKKFGNKSLETYLGKDKTNARIANVAASPFGVLYGVRSPELKLLAVAAVLELGYYASIECTVSTLGNYAQNFMDVHLWRELANKGVKKIEQGDYRKQKPSLLKYKSKFAPVEAVEWVNGRP